MTFLYVLILITLFIGVPVGSFFLVRHIFRLDATAEAAKAETAAVPLSLDKAA